ncbi:hypothetical protein IWW38_005530, partial [Coemansia aciculifera]
MASRRSSGRQGARRVRNNIASAEREDDEQQEVDSGQHKPLPTPRGRDGGQQAVAAEAAAQERQRLMQVFGSYPAQQASGSGTSSRPPPTASQSKSKAT